MNISSMLIERFYVTSDAFSGVIVLMEAHGGSEAAGSGFISAK